MKVNFARMYRDNALKRPDKLALVNTERKREFTYKELDLFTNKICHLLTDHFQLGKGDSYAALLENDNMSFFNFGPYKTEVAGVWLNYRDNLTEHLYQIDYVKPKVIFVEDAVLLKDGYLNELSKRGIRIVCMDRGDKEHENVEYFWDIIEGQSDAHIDTEYDIDEHVILYRFTGGTTGRGKCAMYTFRNIFGTIVQNHSIPDNIYREDTKFLHITPLTHATGAFAPPTHMKGGINYTVNLPDLELLCKTIQEYGITATFAVPTLLYRLEELGLHDKYNLSTLDCILYGASPMSPSKLETLQDKFGNVFVQGYGSTEAFPPVLSLGKKDHIIKTDEDRKRLSAAGQPLLGVDMFVADPEGKEVPAGTIGELWIRSDSVIKGYKDAPEETASEFDNGFWRSGDLGYVDDKGYFYIVDRKKDMIITGGFNVYAVEVENAVNSHPDVSNSVIIGVPHEEWGEIVHAEVVLKNGSQATEQEMIDFVAAKLPKYKVPKSIVFVDELPTSTVGKVLRRYVKEKYWKESVRKVH
ncbi:class I adenylate-forming enzyme family protein [Sporosarcina sp. Marseille-Q4943]|uniref:class I adenylate-forming enzyme family protein n=1 Tax=Sporosarcina sp. Marseille-Q4943 TaxID=2942204 RepID=UPI00208DD934|nr:AMP-binding protein [Sporosarcina sp. Marseille-Q4943]